MAATAQKEKEKGNAAFKAGDFPTAIGHYTAAILAEPSNATYPLNRAAAYLKLGKNEDAERDCDAVLKLDRKNVKGFFRRGQARVALQKLKEAESDFHEALKLEPANDSVKQELRRVQDALKMVPTIKKTRKPIDLTVSEQHTSSSTAPPRRRRVPITIIEPETVVSASTSSNVPSPSSTNTGLLTPVSSRSLSTATSQTPKPSESHTKPPASLPETASTSKTSATPKSIPKTFHEAKAAREESKPRGGIFRSDGKPSLFYAPPQPSAGEQKPKREPPQTLVAFMNVWQELTTEQERWDVLRQIPSTRLPVLFKTSLDATILAAVLRSLLTALAVDPQDAERAQIVRAYMVNLPRVPRFSMVSLMMDPGERENAQAVWDLLGRSRGDGVEGEMDKRKEDGSRAAWGCR